MTQATTLKPSQVKHLLRVTAATSRHPERDCVILLLGITAGMRITEIAQLQVQDILLPSGALRTEVNLRAAITKGCRTRTIYLTHPKTVAALESYLDHRVARGIGKGKDPDRFRGLAPGGMVVLTLKGTKFYLNRKWRVNFGGERIDYLACDSLQAHVTKLYKNAGIKNGSSHSGRRSFASNLLANGADLETVQNLLGHAELDHVLPYLEVQEEKLRAMFFTVL